MDLLQEIARQFNNRCLICFRRYNHIHHIIPKSRGGTDAEDNLVPLCEKHHREIHARGAFNFIGKLQRLRRERIKWLSRNTSPMTTSTRPSYSGTTTEDQMQQNSEK